MSAENRKVPSARRQRELLAKLSPSEYDVTLMIASGMSAKEISYERGTTVDTVRTQIKHAKRKTESRTLNELAALAAPRLRDLLNRKNNSGYV